MTEPRAAHATWTRSSRLHLEDVIGHLLGRDASLGRVDESYGVPKQTKAKSCGDDLAVTITLGERAQDIR